MLPLRAVEPNRLGRILHHDGEAWYRCICWLYGHESREETLRPRHVHLQGLAWLIKRRLNNRVVLWVEMELHHISSCGFDIVGGKGQIAVLVRHLDDVEGEFAALGRHRSHAGGAAVG